MDEWASACDLLVLTAVRTSRPVILLGFSTGARLLFSCLEHLAQHGGEQALGLVESCFMVGAAVPADPVRWQAARQVVSHRLVNGYKRDDLILMLLFRANSLKVGKVAGLEVNQLHSPVFFASLSLHDMCRVCVRFALLNLFFSSFAESSSSSPSTRHRSRSRMCLVLKTSTWAKSALESWGTISIEQKLPRFLRRWGAGAMATLFAHRMYFKPITTV